LSVVFAVLLTEATSDTPDASEDEDPLNTLDLIVVQDILNEIANGNNHSNLHLRNDMLESFSAMEKSVWNVLLKKKWEFLQVLL
jgi:hypothetical protein